MVSEVQKAPELGLEVRRANVIALHSKGLNQMEIAAKLGVNQSTVSRDLKELRRQSRKVIEQRVVRDAMFEFCRWNAGIDEVTKKAWEIAEDEKATHRAKVKALAFLVKCYNKRRETMLGGRSEGYAAQDHVEDIWAERRVYMKNKYQRPYRYQG